MLFICKINPSLSQSIENQHFLIFMSWKTKAAKILLESLTPIPHELNELDWKSGLSPKADKLAKHICAFANYHGGGMFAFGVKDDDASFAPLSKSEMETVVKRLANIAHDALSYSVNIEHMVCEVQGHPVLFVYIPEQREKPIHLRGHDYRESYCRSGGQTQRMSDLQIRNLLAQSQGIAFEERLARGGLKKDEVLSLLDYEKLYSLLGRELPLSKESVIQRMSEYGLCKHEGERWAITNLGAILFAKDLSEFKELQYRSVIVRKYVGNNNRDILMEQIGRYGYAVGFHGLIDFVMKSVSKESISNKRELIPAYPMVALREFIANALVHQDFNISGVNITIEIFANRVVITNPGSPLNDVNRLIDLPPRSRNEGLASLMYQFGFCERRGSGIDRAIAAIEEMLLPAPKMVKEENYTRITLFPFKPLQEMTKGEKIEACYQHACLMNEDGISTNNQSLRGRLGLNKNQSVIASRILADTLEAGLIKIADENVLSKKYATYLPYYA